MAVITSLTILSEISSTPLLSLDFSARSILRISLWSVFVTSIQLWSTMVGRQVKTIVGRTVRQEAQWSTESHRKTGLMTW